MAKVSLLSSVCFFQPSHKEEITVETLYSENFPNQLPLDTDGSKDFMKRWIYLIRSISGLVNRIMKSSSRVRLFSTLWTVAYQASPSMGFPRQEYWSEWPFPPPGDLPDPNIESASLMSPVLAGRVFTTSATWEA